MTSMDKSMPRASAVHALSFLPWALAVAFVIFLLAYPLVRHNAPVEQPPTLPQPTAATAEPAIVPIVQPAGTPTPACVEWRQLVGDRGRRKCVYGVVFDRKRIQSSDADNYSWFLVRFDRNPSTFYLISENDLPVRIGDCVVAESVLDYDTNGVPRMKVSEVSVESGHCPP